MAVDRGTLAKIDRRVFAELGHTVATQAGKVPRSDRVWGGGRKEQVAFRESQVAAGERKLETAEERLREWTERLRIREGELRALEQRTRAASSLARRPAEANR